MEIFHYLANELKDTPNFECGPASVDDGNGAVYNDFEGKNVLLESEQQVTFSQMSEETTNSDDLRQVDTNDIVPKEAVEKSILEADITEALLYNDLSFQTELLDCKSPLTDSAYLEKVYKILAFDWEEILKEISGRVLQIYQMRRRTGWTGSDTVYDSWLIVNDYTRHGFPYKKFSKMFPFWRKVRRERHAEKENDCEQDEVGECSKFIREIVPEATESHTAHSIEKDPEHNHIEDDSKDDISLEMFNGSTICLDAIDVSSSSDNDGETESQNESTEDVKDPNILKIFIAKKVCTEAIVISSDDE